MIIGFDAKRIVCNNTGLGSYSRTLVNDLAAAVSPGTMLNLYTPDEGRDELRNQIVPSPNVRFVYPEHARNALTKAWWRAHGMVTDMVNHGVKLYHGLSGELPVGIKKAGIKTVVTIHDLIFMRHPEWYNPIDAKIYTWKFHKTCREADRIIAISECTKRDIVTLGGVSPAKIDVVYQSCGSRYAVRESEKKRQEVHTRYMLPSRYIINVGSIEERKNILLAVKALHLLPQDLCLVVVGRPTAYADKVKRYIRQNGLDQRVMLLHGVPNEDLPAIYQMAEACVYPSRYEGFGIPVIEAIQSGLPVVACTGSCLEEAGGNGSLYVQPDDVTGMAEAVKRVLKGAPERQERIADSRRYITRFENNSLALQVMQVYERMLKEQ